MIDKLSDILIYENNVPIEFIIRNSYLIKENLCFIVTSISDTVKQK